MQLSYVPVGVYVCVDGIRLLCICVFACAYVLCERKVEGKDGWGGVGAFYEVRAAGRRSCLSFLRMINEDVTKGFLFFSIIRDLHVDGAQKPQYFNYVAVFYLASYSRGHGVEFIYMLLCHFIYFSYAFLAHYGYFI